MQTNLAKSHTNQEDAVAALGRLAFSTDLSGSAADADFVIEAATERFELKQHIFTGLGELAPAHVILATNVYPRLLQGRRSQRPT
jgi:3-hydroxybutyryl-CoA dehydrogenase